VTRLVDISPELSAKRLQLWRETVPGSSGVAVLWNSANGVTMLDSKMTRTAAQAVGMRLLSFECSAPTTSSPRTVARMLGLTIPPAVLGRADETIE